MNPPADPEPVPPPVLHVLGAGRAGATLARAWLDGGAMRIGVVCNSSLQSARDAVALIGAGRAEATPSEIDGGWLMIGVPDARIEAAAGAAVAAGARPDYAFHLSGQHASTALQPLARAGAATASLHPVVSFARPELALERLAEAWCVLEGEARAVSALRRVCQALGMQCIEARGVDKPLYHAATVAASNLVCALLDLSQRVAERAGVDVEEAQSLLTHLAGQLLANVERVGAPEALTGPIERGDVGACERLTHAVERGMSARDRRAFLALADLAADLAARKGSIDAHTRRCLERLFATGGGDC